ncbi:hypothetical protein RHMOL_Rhmol07G0305500 [Rhododendron molle]|uniref:Uncharacterized protein n=1 Tax=Rhododendron molle TaxID=49168 RepID=A0ACC0N7J4_RHOML|nr:hypothetical protein RHMOL_Rhmol07G0305500 [Rhododendron molle]
MYYLLLFHAQLLGVNPKLQYAVVGVHGLLRDVSTTPADGKKRLCNVLKEQKKPFLIIASDLTGVQSFVAKKTLLDDDEKFTEEAGRFIGLDVLGDGNVTAKNRISAMTSSCSGWCISWQRTWHVPIPVFYHLESKEPLLNEETADHIKCNSPPDTRNFSARQSDKGRWSSIIVLIPDVCHEVKVLNQIGVKDVTEVELVDSPPLVSRSDLSTGAATWTIGS